MDRIQGEKGIRIQTRKSMGQTVYRHLQSCLIVLAFHLFVFAITQNYCVPSCACVCFEQVDRPLERPCKADQFFTSKCSLKPFNYTSLWLIIDPMQLLNILEGLPIFIQYEYTMKIGKDFLKKRYFLLVGDWMEYLDLLLGRRLRWNPDSCVHELHFHLIR